MTSFIIDWYNVIMDSNKNPLSNEAAKRKPQIFYTMRGDGGEHE